MPRVSLLLIACAACGGGGSTPDARDDGARADSTNNCAPQPAQGQFTRRANNPRMIAGQSFSDGKIDISISDPDVHYDAASSTYHLYYMAAHATSFSATDKVQVIRHATSTDRVTWSVADAPVFTADPDAAAWDHTHAETPTVVYNPAAPPDRRYLLMYSGAAGTFPGYAFNNYAIGAAFSADGVTFTRVPASESPHGKAGLVLTGKQAYPAATNAIVADPELALVDGVYHLWFSSFACAGAQCETPIAFGVGHATSPDGITWTVLEAPVRSLLRASADTKTGGQQPSVIYDAEHCRYELWQTSDVGNENDAQPVEFNNMMGVYKAESTDGVAWTINYNRARDLQWSQTESGEHLGLLTGADVAQVSSGRVMLYVGFDDENVPSGFFLPDRTQQGFRPGVMTLQVATRDLP